MYRGSSSRTDRGSTCLQLFFFFCGEKEKEGHPQAQEKLHMEDIYSSFYHNSLIRKPVRVGTVVLCIVILKHIRIVLETAGNAVVKSAMLSRLKRLQWLVLYKCLCLYNKLVTFTGY